MQVGSCGVTVKGRRNARRQGKVKEGWGVTVGRRKRKGGMGRRRRNE